MPYPTSNDLYESDMAFFRRQNLARRTRAKKPKPDTPPPSKYALKKARRRKEAHKHGYPPGTPYPLMWEEEEDIKGECR